MLTVDAAYGSKPVPSDWQVCPNWVIKSPSISRSLPCTVHHSSAAFGESLRPHPLNQNLARVRSGLKNAHRLGDEVVERQRTRVGLLVQAHQFGLNIGRRKFEHLDVAVAKLPPQRLRIGMDRSFSRAIGRRY